MKTKVFLAIIAMGLSGCVTRGDNFSSDLAWIKKDKTTQQDVSSLLGSPYSVGNTSGTKTWTYGYYSYKLFGDSYTKELKFYWDKNNSVKEYSFNSSFPEDRSAVLK